MSGLQIRCKVIPGARTNALSGVHAGELVVRLTAAPERGKANAALVKLLARELGVSGSSVTVVRGHTARHKVVSVPAGAADRVRELLGQEP